jgi:uncharacterized protein YndB with AHSA1/START domain
MPLALALSLPVGAFVLYVATRPSAFRFARARRIDAPPQRVFALINDLHQWGRWSPWERLDPAMQKTYEGPDAGVGAKSSWVGPKSGAGSMTITASEADARVALALDFVKPFPAHNVATFTLTPDGDGTRVEWAMEGERNFMMKAFDVVVGMDKMLGKDFTAGLDAMADAATAG